MQGKIVVNPDGIVYFASGFYVSTEEGKYHTNFWRLDARSDWVDNGESAYWPTGQPCVKPDRQSGEGIAWRVCYEDGSYAPWPEQLPPAFSKTIEVPRPRVRQRT